MSTSYYPSPHYFHTLITRGFVCAAIATQLVAFIRGLIILRVLVQHANVNLIDSSTQTLLLSIIWSSVLRWIQQCEGFVYRRG